MAIHLKPVNRNGLTTADGPSDAAVLNRFVQVIESTGINLRLRIDV